MTYEYKDDMGEISGFGGSYEQGCRDMVIAGVEWLDKNPNADPIVKESPRIYGIVSEENESAKELSKVIGDAADGCTGAMHHAAISHVLWIKKNSWEKYVQSRREWYLEEKQKIVLET